MGKYLMLGDPFVLALKIGAGWVLGCAVGRFILRCIDWLLAKVQSERSKPPAA